MCFSFVAVSSKGNSGNGNVEPEQRADNLKYQFLQFRWNIEHIPLYKMEYGAEAFITSGLKRSNTLIYSEGDTTWKASVG